ncbi:MAG TPA: lytic murein transglycosylase [Jatrophihabitantaceae bacterium]|nr:lytic murein transglycosylase [Jatrophihabitantaceae bacterium]
MAITPKRRHRADSDEPYAPRHSRLHLRMPAPPIGPQGVRAVVAIAALAAATTLSGASATHARPKTNPPGGTATPAALPQLPLTPEMLSRGAPPGAKLLPHKPVHVAHPAPATKPVITGLAANGIPNIALNAYRLAAARLASAEPSCGIQWPLLAAIGRVESNHGRFGGAVLYPDGTSLPRIIGIALDGTRSAYIGDTDGGRLDGDTRYDRAVGPMQFIPSTWASWGIDGNGDGVASPFNVDDAALAAARYLCASGGDLRTRSGQVTAVLAYNDSDQYLAQVLGLAAAYAQGVPVDDLPISGPTTGGLPPANPWAGLPVNPALPPAGVTRRPSPAGTAGPGSTMASGARTVPGHPDGSAAPPPSTPRSHPPGSAGPGQPSAPGSSPTPAPTPTRTPSGPSKPPSSPSTPPNPLQTVINGVLCTLSLLGIPICPPS